jgi:hypothetical protein
VTTYPCHKCNKFAFPDPGALCYWCRNCHGERRSRAIVRLGVLRSKAKGPKPEEVVDALEKARLKLHKYRRHEGRGEQP